MNVNFASVDDIKAARRANEASLEAQAFKCCMRTRGAVSWKEKALFPDRFVTATGRRTGGSGCSARGRNS